MMVYVYKIFQIVLLSLSATTMAASIVAPKLVIGEYQQFWATVYSPDCLPQDAQKTRTHYCEFEWLSLPQGVRASSNNMTLSATSLPVGSHEILLEVSEYKNGHLVGKKKEMQQLESVKLQAEVVLSGFPFDIANVEQTVWLANDDKNNFKCVFYDGISVLTDPTTIEDGSLYCKIVWENIPPGFRQKYASNPAMMTGSLLNVDKDDYRDYSFIFKVFAEIPYGKSIELSNSSVDATIDTFDIMQLRIEHPNERKLYKVSATNPGILLDVKVSNAKNRAIKLELFSEKGNELIFGKVIFPEHDFVKVNLPAAYMPALGGIENYQVRVSFADIPSIYKSEVISVAQVPSPAIFPRLNITPQNDGYSIGISSPGGSESYMWIASLTSMETELSSSFYPTIYNDLSKKSNYEDTVGKGKDAQFNLSTALLAPGQYVVKYNFIAYNEVTDELLLVDQVLSEPFSVVEINNSDDTFEKDVLLVQPYDSYILAHLGPNMLSQDKIVHTSWHFGDESDPNINNAELKLSDNAYHSVSKATKHLTKLAVNVAYQTINEADGQNVFVKAYSRPNASFDGPPSVPVNSNTSFGVVLLGGAEINLSEYSVMWNIDGREVGESSKMSLNFTRPGTHIIDITVYDRGLVEHGGLSATHIHREIEVSFDDPE